VRRLLIAILLVVPSATGAQERARNVILFLADAAGIPTLNAASLHGHGAPRKLFIQRMPHIGLADTSTASQLVSDSAAGMTAIVTGQRTHNGVIGQGPDAVRGRTDGTPLKSILEYAEERGLATGVISNDSLAGATPATLYAKVNDRNNTAEIFLQAFTPRAGDGVDVMIGSGRRSIETALAAAGTSLAQIERERGSPIQSSLEGVPADASRAVVLLEDSGFDLAEAVSLARRILSKNPQGYFLMVEADAHTNAIRPGLERLIALDKVIEQTAGEVGADTLLLFTADHSFDLRVLSGTVSQPLLTGTAAESSSGVTSLRLPNVRVDNSHTGEEVLVAAQGPGSEQVLGYMANTDLFDVMLSAFGWSADAR
jgi:alkaline phosphatase